jgi:hypothetical protein
MDGHNGVGGVIVWFLIGVVVIILPFYSLSSSQQWFSSGLVVEKNMLHFAQRL